MIRGILRLAVVPLAYVLSGAIVIVVFIWSGVDLWIALVVAFAGLLMFAWYVDHKSKSRGGGR
jgi:Flp pilus assembly protein TadB